MSPKKRIGLLVLAVALMIVAMPSTVRAESQGYIGIEPHWQHIWFVDASINFTGTTANLFAEVSARTGTTGITATVRLERRVGNGFETVTTWSNLSSSSTSLIFSSSATVTQGTTYRLTITANVTRNQTTETATNSAEGRS